MKQIALIVINCPHCYSPLPNTIDEVDIDDTDEFLGFTCVQCNHTINVDDLIIINNNIKQKIRGASYSFITD